MSAIPSLPMFPGAALLRGVPHSDPSTAARHSTLRRQAAVADPGSWRFGERGGSFKASNLKHN